MRRCAVNAGHSLPPLRNPNPLLPKPNLRLNASPRPAGRKRSPSCVRWRALSPSLKERRIAAADAYERTRIRAPNAGRVLGLNVHTVGGVVAPGVPLMEIVPMGTNLQISAKIAPSDVDKVQSGQSTLVRFSAFGSRRTPETDGTVRTISADSITDEVNRYSLTIWLLLICPLVRI